MDPHLLGPIQHRGEAAQIHLLTVRSRAALVEARTKLINTVRGLAKAMGYRLAAAKADGVTIELLDKLPAAVRAPLERLIQQVQSLSKQSEQLDRQTADIAATHYAPETAKLQRVKGIGPLIALTFVLTLSRRSVSHRAARSVVT